jgi:cytochrome c peroxidase
MRFSWVSRIAIVFLAYVASLAIGASTPRRPNAATTPQQRVILGRYLFYDARLSARGDVSCSSCHRQVYAFSGGPSARNVVPRISLRRKPPSLMNLGDAGVLTWANPHQVRLEDQARVPLFGTHPVEMGVRGSEKKLLTLIRCDPRYGRLFPEAFSDTRAPFSIRSIQTALAAFERTFVSRSSPYDEFRHGRLTALTKAEMRGRALFFSEPVGCARCHGGVDFTDNVRSAGGHSLQLLYHNTGLYNVGNRNTYPVTDLGLAEITGDPEDVGAFRTPSLRNASVTRPYFHDGSAATLRDVIRGYERGGRLIRKGPNRGDGSRNVFRSVLFQPFSLSTSQENDLIAFLGALVDERFIHDSALSNPFRERPIMVKCRDGA